MVTSSWSHYARPCSPSQLSVVGERAHTMLISCTQSGSTSKTDFFRNSGVALAVVPTRFFLGATCFFPTRL